MTLPPLPEPSYDQVVTSIIFVISTISAYFSRKAHRQVKPSNGHRTAEIIEAIREDQILIKGDIIELKRSHTSMARAFTTHVNDDHVAQNNNNEAFRQLGVSQPPGSSR